MDYRSQRQLIRGDLWDEWGSLELDQKLGLPKPQLQKPYPLDATLIDLVSPSEFSSGSMSVREAIELRQSMRKYLSKSLTMEELSYLLWATQGVKSIIMDGYATRRTVPSGGARHPFE